MVRRSNLFIVGEPKCGTTAIYKYLKAHPEIFIPDIKEPRYFAKDLYAEGLKYHKEFGGLTYFKKFFCIDTKKKYIKLYEKSTSPVNVDCSTWHLFSKSAAKEIHEFNPNAKIVCFFREPVSFLYSYYCMKYPVHESIGDFIEALDAEDKRKIDWKLVNNCVPTPSALYYGEWIKYSVHLKRFLNYFSK